MAVRVRVDVEVDASRLRRWDSTARLGALAKTRHNILIEGALAATEATLVDLLPYLPVPIVRRCQGESLALDAYGCRTLILRDVDGLRADQQAALQRWLGAGADDALVISTTTVALFSLVAQGVFDEGLYYRLNTTLVRIQG